MYHPLAKKRINISGQLAYNRKDDCRMSNDLYSFFLYCYGNSIKTRNDTIFFILFNLSLLKGPEGKAWVLSGKAVGRVLQNRGTVFLILTYDHSSEHHSKTMAHFHVILGLHIVNYMCWDTLHSFFPPLFFLFLVIMTYERALSVLKEIKISCYAIPQLALLLIL